LVQVGVPPDVEHLVLQALQLLTSVFRLISQPLAGLPSQSAKPALQAPMAHAPLPQVADALANVHFVPQALQLFASVLRLTSQPLAAEPSQLPEPAVHAPIVQVLLTQLAAALANVHLVPHPPQLFTSFVVLVAQVAPGGQVASPAPQVLYPHAPAVHTGVPPVVGHLVPQALQLFTSDVRFTSQPLTGLPSQLAKPAVHVPIAQVPLLHVAEALVYAQTVLQLLQCAGSVLRLISQPLAAAPSQLA
jgi:hypothetical protein